MTDPDCERTMRATQALCRTTYVTAAAVLSGCTNGVLDPQGPVGAGNRQILLNSLAVMLVIVVPTIIAALWFAWWFRASNPRARYDPGFTYSGRIELIVWPPNRHF